jgi:hypothetical protein
MRTLLSVLVMALFTISAATDASAKGRRPKPDAKSNESPDKKKNVDAAYQKALQSIPDSHDKPDPWKGVRSH